MKALLNLYYSIRNYFLARKRMARARKEYSPRLLAVLKLSIALHGDQRRRYTHVPYWFHVENVMRSMLRARMTEETILAAALLHDTLEDVPGLSPAMLYAKLTAIFDKDESLEVINLVSQLSDEFTKENYPQLNRRERKGLELARFSGASHDAKLVKLADLQDNTRSIQKHDLDFYHAAYKRETDALFKVIVRSHIKLLWFAAELAD
jgi:guanosine-3',5'-bis(diphosphate) 3'-pyrophosphohydrolase